MPYLNELSWRAAEQYFRGSDCVMLGTGAIHGHDHIPMGIDNASVEHVLREVEKRTHILTIPNMPFAPMPEYQDYPGTISISSSAFMNVMLEVIKDLHKWGARKFFVINGHGGSTALLEEIGYHVRRMGGILPVLEWWRLIKSINPKLEAAASAVPAHAAKGRRAKTRGVETAAAMALMPHAMPAESVRIIYSTNIFGDALPTNYFRGVEFKGVQVPMRLMTRESSDDGEVGTSATADMGRQMFAEVVDFVAAFIETLGKKPVPDAGAYLAEATR
jgi:creatinine amidohydrolase